MTRLGKPLYSDYQVKIYYPGLYIKLPFFDKKYCINSTINHSNYKLFYQFLSKKKIYIFDINVTWKIYDFHCYFLQYMSNQFDIKNLLQQYIKNMLYLTFKNIEYKENQFFQKYKSKSIYSIYSKYIQHIYFENFCYDFSNIYNDMYFLSTQNNQYINIFFNLIFKKLGIKILNINVKYIFTPKARYKLI